MNLDCRPTSLAKGLMRQKYRARRQLALTSCRSNRHDGFAQLHRTTPPLVQNDIRQST
jgi:hypothetical protein